MTEPAIDTITEPAPMTPAVRFLRTLLQVVIAIAAATPAAVALVGLSAETTAKVTGIAGACVIVASAIHNTVNQVRSSRAMTRHPATRDRGDIGLVEVLVIILIVIVILVLIGRV